MASTQRKLPKIAVLLILLVAGLVFWRYRSQQKDLSWHGVVEARTMDVGSRIGGRVHLVPAQEGTWVNAGDTLVELEAFDLEAQRAQAEGQLEQAQAMYDRVSQSKKGPNARQEEIAAAKARLVAAQVAERKAAADAVRAQDMFKTSAIPKADLDTALAARDGNAAQRIASQATLDQLLKSTPADVRSARGLIQSAEGRLSQINTFIAELKIVAPKRARVEALDLRPGDMLAPNATAARLLDTEDMYVRVFIPETHMGHVQPGMHVQVFVDSFPDTAFDGVVAFVSDLGEYTPRNIQTEDERANQVFAARVRLSAGAEKLRAGMAASVRPVSK